MPIYEYKCNLCGCNEEILELTINNNHNCHHCGAAMQKQYSTPSILKHKISDTPKAAVPCQGSSCNCPFAGR